MKIGLILLLVGLIIIIYSILIDFTPLMIGVILVIAGYWKDYYKPRPKTPEERAREIERKQRKEEERRQLEFAKKMGYATEQGRQRAIADAETGMGESGREFERGMTAHFGPRDRYDRKKKRR